MVLRKALMLRSAGNASRPAFAEAKPLRLRAGRSTHRRPCSHSASRLRLAPRNRLEVAGGGDAFAGAPGAVAAKAAVAPFLFCRKDRKSTRLNSSPTCDY